MTYRYGLRNTYRPTQLIKRAYGWSSRPGYKDADVPTALMDRPAGVSAQQLQQQFAYEWFQSGDTASGFSNPPFVSGAAGRLLPMLTAGGKPARILRGYIRRAEYDNADDTSKARLYFMYNPEIITRDYVSYLNQDALDPFNTVYQSGNLVAPPSILDFNFDLLFDRQEEAAQENHPGVYVDYQFFDLVVRNVVPSDPRLDTSIVPDNGVMMVNPRDITVIFSPQFTVQGRPINARVSFVKFTHRMTPTRMAISLTIRATYIGPVKDMVEYRAEQFAAESAIPFGLESPSEDIRTMGELLAQRVEASEGVSNNYSAQTALVDNPNNNLRLNALNWAIANVKEGVTRYTKGDTGSARWNLPHTADCSGLVTEAYIRTGQNVKAIFGADGHTDTKSMMAHFAKRPSSVRIVSHADLLKPNILQKGDLLCRNGHVVFFVGYAAGNKFRILGAESKRANPQVGQHEYSSSMYSKDGWIGVRPVPFGASMSYNADNAITVSTQWGV